MFEKIIERTVTSLDRRNFGLKEKILFFKELSYLIGWWVGIVDAIKTIKNNTDNRAVEEICAHTIDFLVAGKSLSYAISREPDYFDEGDVAILASGEKSGNIVTVLQSLAHEYQFINSMRNSYKSALTYPLILIVIAIGAVFALFQFVLPSIFDIADQFTGIELPPTTVFLRNISDFFANYRNYIGGTMAWFIFLWLIIFSTELWQLFLYRMILSTPVIGHMTQSYYLIKLCRYMKIMLSSWMNYVQTFQLLRKILGITIYEKMINNILHWLHQWQTIYDSIKYETQLIPSKVSVLLKVGEETANLSQSLDNIIAIYEEDLKTTIDNLSKLVEPIMLVLIWWIVIVIALGVFGVIMNIMDGVQVG